MRIRVLFGWKALFLTAMACIVSAGALAIIDRHVGNRAAGRMHLDVRKVPPRPVALLLGTSKYVARGRPNLFYTFRIRAAARLFHAGKVRAILVSGDNSRRSYNEPEAMKGDLVAAGVPAKYITLDFAGRRTLDSVVRAKAIFGQPAVVIVSQHFHSGRAIYIADAHGIDAVAYLARGVRGRSGLRIRLREVLARTRAFLDVNLLDMRPRFGGKRETVTLKPLKTARPKAERK
ncbi:MAG TPA: ElyC/SanA/YdcF family protein [Alphaproteobacteria bacterium]|nr:ElyC/SanA/YdcF family protein [Alphaproteobacteria bacterium]